MFTSWGRTDILDRCSPEELPYYSYHLYFIRCLPERVALQGAVLMVRSDLVLDLTADLGNMAPLDLVKAHRDLMDHPICHMVLMALVLMVYPGLMVCIALIWDLPRLCHHI
eukprot:TRINITY_DN12019_c0_g1::TRINITY_DN12019_c0_g1_i1::g.17024::m.17024 TRINITY_DN12019_c0_g1::TRINITY_DN12019_c0_g1_i1::g.17024  ORF type:complete len:111 (+),score=14.81 TRINITY_DN12019_c0_g1_i1:1018-1350(+)